MDLWVAHGELMVSLPDAVSARKVPFHAQHTTFWTSERRAKAILRFFCRKLDAHVEMGNCMSKPQMHESAHRWLSAARCIFSIMSHQ